MNIFKRIFALLLVFTLLALPRSLLSSCDVKSQGETTTLYVYNWGEYMSDGSEGTLDSNRAFELWYEYTYGERVDVVYSTYSSNEDMYAKLSGGAVSYDIIVPSDYMIERLISEGENGESLLSPLNKENIPHMDNLSPSFYGENAPYDYYDEGNIYSVPYFYGMIGIIYNTTMVEEEDIGSWDIMWNEKYKGNILQFNNSGDALAPLSTSWASTSTPTTRTSGERLLASLKRRRRSFRATSWTRSSTKWRAAVRLSPLTTQVTFSPCMRITPILNSSTPRKAQTYTLTLCASPHPAKTSL